ncbi:methylmalonyl-CoA mutase subunit beta [Marssonina coronariae]|uniref:Methylmalonyl-CoA mutase subunit beta n=1 Tax=Diplocarpon coronariae TaxID=2795749 RepID=A0A218Z2W9_9HELO|nr:methylmalonyl-CoA mutase subunit beta [Marssonina coronariae]
MAVWDPSSSIHDVDAQPHSLADDLQRRRGSLPVFQDRPHLPHVCSPIGGSRVGERRTLKVLRRSLPLFLPRFQSVRLGESQDPMTLAMLEYSSARLVGGERWWGVDLAPGVNLAPAVCSRWLSQSEGMSARRWLACAADVGAQRQ